MIEIAGLTQKYGNRVVLDGVNLTIDKNETCALVGRNGAGKSTLMASLVGLLPVRRGTVKLGGIPVSRPEWKKIVSYLPEKFALYPQLTGEENLRFFASAVRSEPDNADVEKVLKTVGLWEHRADKIHEYSKGMLQRLGLGIMLYFDTDILILDEPTSGLDPEGRREILSILGSLKGKTILFSSHHIDEIEQICTHVAWLENKTVRKYAVDEFLRQWKKGDAAGCARGYAQFV